MSPVVEAAWIAAIPGSLGIIGTVVVSIVGSRATQHATTATINADHKTRVWEKRAAVYEDVVREVLARRTRREVLTSRGDIGNIGSKPVKELRKAEEPEIIRIQAALRPYASANAWEAYAAANEANTAFWRSLFNLVSANRRIPDQAGRIQQTNYQDALKAMHAARAVAAAADEALFDVINCELSDVG